jgi:hypothetical protein
MYSFPTFGRTATSVLGTVNQFGTVFNNTVPVPVTPNGPGPVTPEMNLYFLGGNTPEVYAPMGKENTIFAPGAPITTEIYRGEDPSSEMRLNTATGTGDFIDQNQNYSLPLLNVEYVLINSGLGSLFNPGDAGI